MSPYLIAFISMCGVITVLIVMAILIFLMGKSITLLSGEMKKETLVIKKLEMEEPEIAEDGEEELRRVAAIAAVTTYLQRKGMKKAPKVEKDLNAWQMWVR